MAEIDLQRVVEEIADLDDSVRFVGIIGLNGEIVEGIMKGAKTSLATQREDEHFCRQIAERRRMREGFDGTLGKVRYIHVEREHVAQLVVYSTNHTVFVTVEPETSIARKFEIINGLKEIVARYDA